MYYKYGCMCAGDDAWLLLLLMLFCCYCCRSCCWCYCHVIFKCDTSLLSPLSLSVSFFFFFLSVCANISFSILHAITITFAPIWLASKVVKVNITLCTDKSLLLRARNIISAATAPTKNHKNMFCMLLFVKKGNRTPSQAAWSICFILFYFFILKKISTSPQACRVCFCFLSYISNGAPIVRQRVDSA